MKSFSRRWKFYLRFDERLNLPSNSNNFTQFRVRCSAHRNIRNKSWKGKVQKTLKTIESFNPGSLMKHAFNVGLPDKKASRKRSKTRRGSQKQRQAVMRELPVKTIVTGNPWERWSLGKRDYVVRLKNCAMRKGAMLNKLCRVRAANELYTYRLSLLRFRTKTRKKGIGKDRQERRKLAKGR